MIVSDNPKDILDKANIINDDGVLVDRKEILDPNLIILDSGSYIDEDVALEIIFIPFRDVHYKNAKTIRRDIPKYLGINDSELFPYILLVDSEGKPNFIGLEKDMDDFKYTFSDTKKIIPDDTGITERFGTDNHPIITKKFYIPKLLYHRSKICTSTDLKTINRFYDGPPPPPKRLFDDFKVEFQTYVDVEKWVHTSLTLWTLGTFFNQIFDAYPYALTHKVKGSGKTRTLRTIEALSKDGIHMDNTSLSAMFRWADTYHPTLCLDQLEKLSDKDQVDFVSALCSGFNKGGNIHRSETKNDKWVPKLFNIYCPKALASTKAIDSALEDRCLHIPIQKSMRIKEFSRWPNIEELKPLRDSAYIFALYEGPGICHKLNRGKFIEFDDMLLDADHRTNLVLKPLLVMAEILEIIKDNDEYENICKIIEYEKKIHTSESLDEFDNKLIVACKKLIGGNESVWATNKEIVGEMNPNSQDQQKYYQRVIGKRMKNWLEFPKRMVNGNARYHIRCDRIEQVIARYNVEYEEGEIINEGAKQQQI